jgi:medium-chain acyl-[acyl-carrier-protein] hydrolase
MNWIEPLKSNPEAKIRLICCHHSGVGASTYYPWIKQIPNFVELNAIQLPGRETRFGETLLTNLDSVIEGLMKDFLKLLDKPYLLFGHSVGALIVYELSKKLQAESMPLPKTLIISGSRAPHLPPLQNMHLLSENEFIEKLALYNGTPQEVLNNKDLLELFLPILRADFCIGETYRYQESLPIQCDIVALGGTDDPTVSLERLQEWKMHTASHFNLHLLPGDHFFVKSSLDNVLAIINKIATQCLKKEDIPA